MRSYLYDQDAATGNVCHLSRRRRAHRILLHELFSSGIRSGNVEENIVHVLAAITRTTPYVSEKEVFCLLDRAAWMEVKLLALAVNTLERIVNS